MLLKNSTETFVIIDISILPPLSYSSYNEYMKIVGFSELEKDGASEGKLSQLKLGTHRLKTMIDALCLHTVVYACFPFLSERN